MNTEDSETIEIHLVTGLFYFDAEQNYASLLLIHIEPLEES